jgi:2-iminobutanoate/2-iminopropanoate deaminase
MSKTAITSPELAPPVGPFSQAIEVGGFLYFSGQVGQDPATGKVVEGGIVAETERVLRNLSAISRRPERVWIGTHDVRRLSGLQFALNCVEAPTTLPVLLRFEGGLRWPLNRRLTKAD